MRLRGAGIGAGTAIGTAAVVRVMSGVPLPPEIPPRILQERAGGRNSELPDVIVVAAEFRNALAIAGAISWANVVGIAAERSETHALPCPFPAVVGLIGLLEAVADDMLLLLDAAAGVLLADPDPVAIMQYQAESEHLAPKRRVFLEDAHCPATTLDGQAVRVMARAENSDALAAALAAGADALYIPASSEFFPENDAESLRRARQFAMIEAGGGKPLFVELAPDYSLASILEDAAKSDYTLVLSGEDGTEDGGVTALSLALHEAYQALQESRAVAVPRIAAALSLDSAPDLDALTSAGAERLTTRYPLFSIAPEDDLTNLVELAALAAIQCVPLYFHADCLTGNEAEDAAALGEMVGAGISGIIVPSGFVAEVKDIISGLNFETRREAVLRRVNAEANG